MIIKCESCGRAFQSSKDVFCPHCGAVATKSGTVTKTQSQSQPSTAFDYSGKFSPLNMFPEADCSHGGNRNYDEYGEGSRQKSFALGERMHTSRTAGPFGSLGNLLKQISDVKPQVQKKTHISLLFFIIILISLLFFVTFIITLNDNLDSYDYSDSSYAYETEVLSACFDSPEVFVNPDESGCASVYITYDGFYSDDDTGMLEDTISSVTQAYCFAEVFEKDDELGYGNFVSMGLQIQEDCVYIDDKLECGKYYAFEDFGEIFCTTDDFDCSYSLQMPFDVLYISPKGEAKLFNALRADNGKLSALKPYENTADGSSDESAVADI